MYPQQLIHFSPVEKVWCALRQDETEQLKLMVIDCLACPSTGTMFMLVYSEKNRKYVIWFTSDKLPLPGESIEIKNGKVFIDGVHELFNVMQISYMEPGVWKFIEKGITCPGRKALHPEFCTLEHRCNFRKCPYGVQKYKSSLIMAQ